MTGSSGQQETGTAPPVFSSMRRASEREGIRRRLTQRETAESVTSRRAAKAVQDIFSSARYSASVMVGGYCQMAGESRGEPAPGGIVSRESPRTVGKKTSEDLEAEARVRAHLRQQMEERHITRAELARRIGSDDGNMTRILDGDRGIGLGLVLRICRGLRLTPTRLLEEDPPDRYRAPWARNNNKGPQRP